MSNADTEPTPTPPQAGGRKPQEIAQVVLSHCARHFDELAAMCDTAGESGPQRAPAFHVAAEECRTALTGGFGWMLDLQKELAAGGTGGGGQPPTQGETFAEWMQKIPKAVINTWQDGWDKGAAAAWHHQQAKINALASEVQALRAADPARRQQTPPAAAIVCTCGMKGAKPKHHESGCPVWEQYIRELDAAVAANDAPPRPPQGRRQRKGYCDNCGERNTVVGECPPPCRDCHGTLCERCCDEAKAKRATQPTAAAPTPAPTLTAAERETLDHAAGCLAKCGLHGLGGEVQAIRGRLLAAGAPTAVSDAAERHMRALRQCVAEVQAFAQAHHDHQKPHVLLHSLTVDIPAMCERALAAGADAAPAAEGASE